MAELAAIEIDIIFIILAITLIIGFANRKSGENAGRAKASLLTITVSIVVTFSSSIAMMGVPSEYWKYGPRYCIIGLTYIPVALVVCKYFIPRFCGHGFESSFEVLTRRFDKNTSKLVISIYLFQCSIYLGVTLYAPAQAIVAILPSADLITILSVLFLICIVTTALGGMKAVLVSDLFYGCVMIFGQSWILVSGFREVFTNRTEYKFPEYEYDVQNFTLYSIWDSGIGGFFMCLYLYGVNQASIQRYLSASSVADAKKSIIFTMLALTLVLLIGVGFGALIEMEYPNSSGLPEGVERADQLMIFFIFENYGNGLFRGLFVGCMISAALSTASSIIAVISSTVHLDLLEKKSRRFGRFEITGRAVSVITGILCYLLALIIAHSGNSVIKLAMTNFGVCGGPILGLYSIAFFTNHRTRSAQLGTLFSLIITSILGYLPVFKISTGIPFLFLSFVGFISVLLVSVTVEFFLPFSDKESEYEEKTSLKSDH